MKISHIREAPLIRAYLLIDQEKNKKGFKAIQPEITKMSEVFGIEFDRNLHLILFNDIDFKDLKNLQNPKKRKIQYFLQEFPQFIERQDFTEIFSRILMDTKNTGSANEIFNGLNKICKLNIENQMKLIISFFMCDVEKYQKEAKNILLEKCKEIYKDKKLKNLTESTVNTILTVLDIVNDDEENDDKNSKKSQIEEYTKYFLNYDEEFNPTSADDIPQISDLDKILDTGNEDPIELEKLIIELGPFIINNGINITNSELIDSDINEKRLSNFIIFILNNSTIKFDDDLKELNKIFLESLNINEVDNKDYKSLLDEQLNKDLKWDLDKIYDLFKVQIKKMDVNNILNSFDDPSFSIKGKKTFDLLIEILFKLHIFKEESKNNPDIFFNNLIFNKWDNEINQIEFIDFMINNKEISENSQFALKKYDGTKISDDLINKTKPKQNIKANFLIENWRITDLTKCLLNLSKGEFYNSVKEIFKWPIQNIPELFSLVLVNIIPEADAFLYDELIYEVIPQILTDKNSNQKLIDEIWNTNKELIISIIAKMWENDTDIQNLNNIFEISNTKLNESLPLLVSSKYYNFSVNLGIFAAKREKLNLEQWLKERINKVGDEFLESLLDYIKKNLIQQTLNSNNKGGVLEKAQLNIESLAIILDNIIRSRSTVKLSQKTQKYIQEIYKSIFEIYDELQVQPVNSEEIEKESNQLLSSMFNGEISVDDVINKLINYKKSTIQKENEIYALTIHSVFDEYRFLNQYPEKENKIMAELFGKAINNKLIDGIIKTIALKFILEGIKIGKGPLYNFGTIALSQFIDKISIWPNFMNSLIEVPQIKNEKDLYQKLLQQFNENKNKEKVQNEGNEYTEKNNMNINNSKNNDTNNSKQYDNLRERLSGTPISFTECENINSNNNENNQSHSPPGEIMYKITVLFSSINKNNMKEKVKELKNILKDEKFIKWFSQFFVTKKLISENSSTFQLYDEIINQIDNKDLNKQIIKDVIINFRFLTSPENTCSEKKIKEILKNLGTWLGIFLISRNRPIFAKDLDFKELIFNSYENGKLCIIIPFICKVFKYVAKSKVFHIKNPWINAILCLLKELCNKSSIDNSVKDEIKSLFKIIDVDTNSLTITKDLDKYHVKKTTPYFYKNKSFEIEQKFLCKEISDLEDYINNLLGIFNSDPNFNTSFFNRKNNSNTSENSSDNIPDQTFVIRFLMTIMASSLQQTLPYIIDSSVKTSINTAISIVNKDFMFEKNENKYSAAIENTMKILVKSLSDFNSRDKLKTQIDIEFEKYLKGRKLKDETVTKIKQQPNSEFLHIGLKYIQKEISKVAPKILHDNPIFKEEIEKRKKNNKSLVESEDCKKFKEKIKNIPTELQPNEKNISDNAYKIYENFGKIFDTMNNYEDNTKYTFLNTIYRILKEVLDNMGNSKARCNNYDLCMKNIENVSEKADNNYNDDQQLICIEKIISESKINDIDLATELSLNTLKYAINSAKNNNLLLLNVYSFILKGWVKLHSEISTEITKYLLGYDDIFIRYKYELHLNFIKKKLIDYKIYENYFLDLLSNNEVDLLAKNLLQKIYNTIINSNKSNKTLLKDIEPYYIDKNSNNFFAFFKRGSQFASYVPDSKLVIKKQNDQNYINQLNNFVHQFTTLIYYTMKNYDNFDVNTLRKEYNIFAKNSLILCDEKFSNFLQIICSICIKGPPDGLKIKPILCFPKNISVYIYYSLYACIIKKDKGNKLKIFTHMLQGIYSYFHKDYIKARKDFDQRAYYKLFYNLIYLIDQNSNEENILDSDYPKINYLFKIIEILRLISPLNYQLFTMGWLDLLSAHHLISNFLETPLYPKKKEKNEKYEKYCLLILDILSYLDSFGEKSINHYNYVIFLNQIYKFFFFLCNTYPEFVSNYYNLMIISLSNNLSNYLQLKNMILSTVPNSFDAEIPINEDEENSQQQEAFEKSATILVDMVSVIEKNGNKELIEKFINDSNESHLDNLVKMLENIDNEKEINKILNIIVIYWGLKHKSEMTKNKIKSKEEFYKFYSYLLINLNKNIREVLIHALLNALRYPCMQTESYSILYQELFLGINNEEIEEHLLNNLLERLLYKPYPWGIRYTLVNLVKKEKFKKMNKNYSNDKINIMEIIDKMTKVAIEYKEGNLANYC